MKFLIRETTVETFKSGEREGEWRTLTLPFDAVVIEWRTFYIGDHKCARVTYMVPE